MALAEAAQVERVIREHVLARYVLGSNENAFSSDEDLFASGRVDSMGVMEIIFFVEDAFLVVVDDLDIVPENFRSVRAIAEFVAAKQAPS